MQVQLQPRSLQLCTLRLPATRALVSILGKFTLNQSATVQVRLTVQSQMHSWCPPSRAVTSTL